MSIFQVFGAGDPPFGEYGYLTPYMMWVPYMKGVYQVSSFYVNISGFWGWGPPLWGVRLFNSIYDVGTLYEGCIPSFSLLRQYLRFLGLGTPPLGIRLFNSIYYVGT